MAVAWTLSICYVKISGEDKNAFREKYNDDFTHNKTIQKIRESYRVSREEKKN